MATFNGTSGSDTITPQTVSSGVTAVPAGSYPSTAADTINGLGGVDEIAGGGGGDTINGGGGRDSIYALGGGNVVHGNGGDDRVAIGVVDSGGVNPATNAAWGDDGNDDVLLVYGISGEDFNWVGNGPTGTIRLHGGAGNDTVGVYGGVDTYLLNMAGTTVYLYGEAGNDRLNASSYDPNSDGSPYGGNNVDYLYGGPGNDSYAVFETTDVVIEKAGQGYDAVKANGTDYTLSPNIEELGLTYNWLDFPRPEEGRHGTGNALGNLIIGTDLNETLDGLGGNDTIYGSFGNFKDSGMPDRDMIRGGAGHDTIYGGDSDDDREDGSDTIYGDTGNDTVWAGGGDDVVYGGSGQDKLYGQSDSDRIYGGGDRDWLGGGTGNDYLYGQGGPDILSGREGSDRLSGGGGNDRYDYDDLADSSPGAANRDVILDFGGVGEARGDLIDLSAIDAITGQGGNQAFDFIGTNDFNAAGQVRVVASGGYTLVQANTDGTLDLAELEILVKDGSATPGQWEAEDFIL